MDMKNVRTVTTDWGQKKFWEEQAQEVSCRPDAMHMASEELLRRLRQ